MYMLKSKGLKTEPWGTPNCTEPILDLHPPRDTNCLRFERKNLNQFNAVSVTPKTVFNQESKREWCKVSKAALRSSKIRIDREPESAAINRSLVTLTNAVSVLCNLQKPDWRASKRLFKARWVYNWEATVHSSTLAKKGGLEMGRKLLMFT